MKTSTSKLLVTDQPVHKLKNNPANSRTHSKQQIRQIANSIERFGFASPILVDKNDTVVAGHGRLEAAKLLGIVEVPTIRLEDLSPDQVRAYAIADNRLAEKAGWDSSILAIELQHLLTLDNFDVCITGFEIPEIDLIIDKSSGRKSEPNEVIEFEAGPAVTRSGDVWSLGKHRVICGNSLQESTFRT